jgi:hypothetical protein
LRSLVLIPSTYDLPDGLSPSEWQSNVAAAAASWNAVLSTCSDLRLEVGAATRERLAVDDGQTVLIFRTRAWCHNDRCSSQSTYPLNTMAMTSTYPERATGALVRGADVEFNGKALRRNAPANGATTTNGGEWKFFAPDGRLAGGLQTVVLHELGHVLGLSDHCGTGSCVSTAPAGIMLAGWGTGEISEHDVAEVCGLHGRRSGCSGGCAIGTRAGDELTPVVLIGIAMLRLRRRKRVTRLLCRRTQFGKCEDK